MSRSSWMEAAVRWVSTSHRPTHSIAEAEKTVVVRFPPDDEHNCVGWVKALLSDLAGHPMHATELLQAVWDVQTNQLAEWSMVYNVYGVELLLTGATITFLGDSCSVPFKVLEKVLTEHIGL